MSARDERTRRMLRTADSSMTEQTSGSQNFMENQDVSNRMSETGESSNGQSMTATRKMRAEHHLAKKDVNRIYLAKCKVIYFLIKFILQDVWTIIFQNQIIFAKSRKIDLQSFIMIISENSRNIMRIFTEISLRIWASPLIHWENQDWPQFWTEIVTASLSTWKIQVNPPSSDVTPVIFTSKICQIWQISFSEPKNRSGRVIGCGHSGYPRSRFKIQICVFGGKYAERFGRCRDVPYAENESHGHRIRPP